MLLVIIVSVISSIRKMLCIDYLMRWLSMLVFFVVGGGGWSFFWGSWYGMIGVWIRGFVIMICVWVGGVFVVFGVWIFSGV